MRSFIISLNGLTSVKKVKFAQKLIVHMLKIATSNYYRPQQLKQLLSNLTLSRLNLKKMSYQTEERGSPNTLNYRIFYSKNILNI